MCQNEEHNKTIPHCRDSSKIKKKSLKDAQLLLPLFTANTKIHHRSIAYLGIGKSIKRGGVKIVLWAQINIISELEFASNKRQNT